MDIYSSEILKEKTECSLCKKVGIQKLKADVEAGIGSKNGDNLIFNVRFYIGNRGGRGRNIGNQNRNNEITTETEAEIAAIMQRE